MQAVDYRVALARLGLSRSQMADILKVNRQTSCNWYSGKSRIPYPVELVITRMLDDQKAGEDA